MMFGRLLLGLAVCCLPFAAAEAVAIDRVVSPQGIEAWLVQDHSNPIIVLDVAFKGGASLDPENKAGLAEMVASLLDEGAGDLDSQAFHGKLEGLSIGFGFSTDHDVFRGRVKTLSVNRDTAFDMLRLSLTQPRFDNDAVERIRGQIQAELAQSLQNPETIAQRAFAKQLYPDHPYGRPIDGTPESINAIGIADLKDWVGNRLGRDRMVVSVVGDISPADLASLLDRTFGALPAKTAPAAVADTTPVSEGHVAVVRRANPQSVLLFGQAGLKRNDPDWYVAFVMNQILGGGNFSSRLMNEVRVKRGLAYGAYSYLVPHDHAAAIEGSVATRNERVAESLQLVRQEWRRMADKGVSARELADAKTYLNGSFPLQLDGTQSIASLIEVIQLENLGIDYLDRRKSLIDKVSAEDVRRIAKRLLDPDHLSAIVVGDPQGL